MPEKNIPDAIQSILDKNKGFMKLKDLPALMSLDMKRQLGLKRNSSASAVMKKLEGILQDRFIFRRKGTISYILTPCLPSDLVLSSLPDDKPISPKILAKSLPFNATDFTEILNDLVSSGRAKIILNDKLEARVIASSGEPATSSPEIQEVPSGEYTREKFREAFRNSDKGRTFVRIFRLRRFLGWPREVFDDMLRRLRDEEAIQMHAADATVLKPDEFNDGFMDETNTMMGTVTWNE
ncbi:MAG: hypothetical protein IJG65_09750 [Synergistaceae bacterium]|nr:hypothetical protein [Synergistaceae bacterium]